MAFVNTVDKYGDNATVSMIIDRTITEYCDSSVKTIKPYCFFRCTALAVVDVPMVTYISANAFYICSALKALVLRNTSVVPNLLSANAFNNTPIKSGTGYIYVPRALVDTYKAATNWSTYSAQFRALEDYTVDGTVTGDLDETKI